MEISTLITDEDYQANTQAARTYHDVLMDNQEGEVWDYLTETRGLHVKTLRHFMIGEVPAQGGDVPAGHDHVRGYAAIPYMNERGVTALRFRAMPSHEGAKYMDLSGAGTWLYNITAINEGTDTITICEGEIDTMTAYQMGLNAVGLAGAQRWKQHHRNLLEGFSHIRVLCDNDDAGAGMEMGETIKKDMPNAYVELLPAPKGNDVNSAYLEGGAENLLNYWGIEPDFFLED